MLKYCQPSLAWFLHHTVSTAVWTWQLVGMGTKMKYSLGVNKCLRVRTKITKSLLVVDETFLEKTVSSKRKKTMSEMWVLSSRTDTNTRSVVSLLSPFRDVHNSLTANHRYNSREVLGLNMADKFLRTFCADHFFNWRMLKIPICSLIHLIIQLRKTNRSDLCLDKILPFLIKTKWLFFYYSFESWYKTLT